jgi:hypothetical protein
MIKLERKNELRTFLQTNTVRQRAPLYPRFPLYLIHIQQYHLQMSKGVLERQFRARKDNVRAHRRTLYF